MYFLVDTTQNGHNVLEQFWDAHSWEESLSMPRHARVVLPQMPHHIIHRGHNRQVVFAHDDDYAYYLDTLQTWKAHYGVKVYAFCLMTNHVHLLMEPGTERGAFAHLMKRVAAPQTRYVNRLEGRTGTLWESRYKSSPVETETYFLACARSIELNPVRARLMARPEDHPWSSLRDKLGLRKTPWLDPDPCYEALGRAPANARSAITSLSRRPSLNTNGHASARPSNVANSLVRIVLWRTSPQG